MDDISDRMQAAAITDDPGCIHPSLQASQCTQEPHHLACASPLIGLFIVDRVASFAMFWACRSLHEHEQVADMVGHYNPNVADPSRAMMNVAVREWDSDKLDHGCQLLQSGMGLKVAAREV